jgi:hypothetical protein
MGSEAFGAGDPDNISENDEICEGAVALIRLDVHQPRGAKACSRVPNGIPCFLQKARLSRSIASRSCWWARPGGAP